MILIVQDDSLLLRQVGAPPLLEILLGRQDEWMLKERGEAALDYINFQRMFIIISVQINIFSVFAFLVNFFATTSRSGFNEDKEEFSFTPLVNRTSLSNQVEDSKWHFYHVVASSMLPYLVLITAHLFIPTCLTNGDNPESRFFTMCNKYVIFLKLRPSTLVVRGLNHKAHSPTAIRSYFQQVHPHVTIRWCDHSFILTHFKAGQSLGGRTPVVFGGSC